MTDLAGKVALVTGASRGIGRAVALALARAGLHVAVNYRTREAEAQRVVREIQTLGRRTLAVQTDVVVASEVARMVTACGTRSTLSRCLSTTPGAPASQSWRDIQEADWSGVLNNNLTSAFLITQAVLPEMCARHWGRIVNISSGAARTGGVVGVHYTAAKAGLLGLTRAYAKATVTDGVTVNAVAPALIDTEMRMGDRATRERMIPIGRLGTVEEVAAAVMLLVQNGYMTGQTVHLNGGLYFT